MSIHRQPTYVQLATCTFHSTVKAEPELPLVERAPSLTLSAPAPTTILKRLSFSREL